jgi:hypothetical protein
MSIRSVDEWRKIMTDLTPNEAANKIVAELDGFLHCLEPREA